MILLKEGEHYAKIWNEAWCQYGHDIMLMCDKIKLIRVFAKSQERGMETITAEMVLKAVNTFRNITAMGIDL